MNKKLTGFRTMCVHAGEHLDIQGGIHIPLYNHDKVLKVNYDNLVRLSMGLEDASDLIDDLRNAL